MRRIGFRSAKPVLAIYVFADMRGFTAWSDTHHDLVDQILDPTYLHAQKHFEKRFKGAYHARIVKVLGDGFFSVNELSLNLLRSRLAETLDGIGGFLEDFQHTLAANHVPDGERLKWGFGISFGGAHKFVPYPNHAYDYCGTKVNLAAKLCYQARPSGIVLDADLIEAVKNLEQARILDLDTFSPVELELPGLGRRWAIVSRDVSL
jgi:class 3 adenylate cyclase